MNYSINSIKPIQIPQLGASDYGANIMDAFNTINTNFSILANRDFIKGDKGDSLITKTIKLENDQTILNLLINAVKSQYIDNPNQPGIINNKTVLDWFNSPGNITLIYEYVNGEEIIISSLPYIFKDVRFEEINKVADISEYDGETDYSCAIYFTNGEFVPVQMFPTIYYDSQSKQFSWKLNGVETGLEAMGPKGKPGKDGVFKVVKATPESDDIFIINKILKDGKWVDISRDSAEIQKQELNNHGIETGSAVIIITGSNENDNTYISDVYENDDKYYVVRCADETKILEIFPMENIDVLNACKTILSDDV